MHKGEKKEEWKLFDGFVRDKDGNLCMKWLIGDPKEIFELCRQKCKGNLGGKAEE